MLKAAVQTSLAFDVPAVRRVALDATSWMEHHTRWLREPEALLHLLAKEASWEHRRRWMVDKFVVEPRLTAEYPKLADCQLAPLVAVGRRLSSHYGVDFERAWLNLYRDGNDSTSWHADKPACLRPEAIVPVLSLGETRRFLIRRKDGGSSQTFIVESGDLIVMGGRTQREWVHAVPKELGPKGSRVSINFASR